MQNPGIMFDPDWVRNVTVDEDEVHSTEEAVAESASEANVSASFDGPAILARMDLTSLSGRESSEDIRRLCARARDPGSLLSDGNGNAGPLGGVPVAAVCTYPIHLRTLSEELADTGVRLAVVAGGFPHGNVRVDSKVSEISGLASTGVDEIDVMANLSFIAEGRWSDLYDELARIRDAARGARLKVILETGEQLTFDHVARSSLVAMMAGVDFVKTSTGKASRGATLGSGLVMSRQIAEYASHTGGMVGLKASGGIRTPETARTWLALVRKHLGETWLHPHLFRFGASSLLDSIVTSSLRSPSSFGDGSGGR